MISAVAILYILSCISLFVYSYGFLDFNLTLSSNPLFLAYVAPLQHLVYFDRPLSIKIYIAIMLLMFVCYIAMLAHRKTEKRTVFPWKLFVFVVSMLTLAYPMLSYDVFNYMFHGKILWFYQMNPHVHAPLEFSGDLWLRFMRWVHTSSAYGPIFTAIESPAYLLGLGKFVPVLLLMKITMSAFFVWCIYLVGRIGDILGFSKSKIVVSQLLLAFNPFILMDSVVNGHNDAVMMALFLLAIFYSIKSKVGLSFLSLLASIGTKYMTALTLPIYFIRSPQLKVWFSFVLLLLPVLVLPGRFQPWYLVWALIPAALVDHKVVRAWIIFSSLAGLIFYMPYIRTGFWVNSLNFVIPIVYAPIILSFLVVRFKKLSL
jgi:hypothetical protein